MKNSLYSCLLAVAILSGCATTYKMESLTPDEQAYVSKISSASPTFEVEKSKSEKVWSRGNSFINKYSGMKIQSSNEFHVSTYDPNASDLGTIGYELTKELNGNKVKFSIKCLTKFMNAKYTPEVCANNEKVMSHYMQTGEINEKFVNAKVSTGSQTQKN
jgi:hypothetical protein